MTEIVNLKWGVPFDVYIGRGPTPEVWSENGQTGYYGNPFSIGRDGDRYEVIQKYRIYFYKRLAEDEEFRTKIQLLKGKRLACFCAPKPCHGSVIVEYLDGGESNASSCG